VAAQRRKLAAAVQSARKMSTARRTEVNDIVEERDEEAWRIELGG
jgi:hypothetical protein